ncbi:MAG: c-type cytochrome [Hyphomicrobiaceae bacterium]
MLSRSFASTAAALIALAAVPVAALALSAADIKVGTPITEADVAHWDIDVSTSDGKGLPVGKGSVAEGEKIFAEKCVTCHGDKAAGGSMYGSMVGGVGSFLTDKRKLTPGSMYPYAPILFDYIRRAMPMTAPQSLTDNEVYALSAYILHLNELVPADGVLDAASLTAIKMPNRDGFIVDDRPDTKAERCMEGCKPIKE